MHIEALTGFRSLGRRALQGPALTPLIVLMALHCHAQGRAALEMELNLVKSEFCRGPSGEVIWNPNVGFTYRNNGHVPVVLFRYALISRQTLFAGEGDLKDGSAERDTIISRREIFDASKLDPSKPDPKLFTTMAPDTSFESGFVLWMVVGPAGQSGRSLLGRDHYLRLVVDPWPARRTLGAKLRNSWKPYGLLWMDAITSAPLRIHLEQEPDVERRCEQRFRMD